MSAYQAVVTRERHGCRGLITSTGLADFFSLAAYPSHPRLRLPRDMGAAGQIPGMKIPPSLTGAGSASVGVISSIVSVRSREGCVKLRDLGECGGLR